MSVKIERTPEMEKQILDLLTEGKLITEIAPLVGISIWLIQHWRLYDLSFAHSYSRAQSQGFEVQADSLITIPDTYEDVNKARLKCDSIRWVLARRASDKYGDRLDINVNQTIDIGLALTEARRRTQAIDITPQLEQGDTGLQPVDPQQKAIEDILS